MLAELVNVGHVFCKDGRRGVSVQALRAISLKVYEGQYTAIMGPSGSGKSTLLHVLGALLRPTEGDYCFGGRSTRGMSDRDLSQLRLGELGFVFQGYNLLEGSTALENVAMPMKLAGVPTSRRLARSRDLLDRVGLAGRHGHRPKELSGGEEQRVAIARALANDPALLLMDEPTGNLDSAAQMTILGILDSVHSGGTALVVVTHNPAVAEHAEHIISLADGRLAGEESDHG